MNKVMTRAQRRPETRPPSRRDLRRPAGTAPPRTPGGGPARTPAADGRPPGSARATSPGTGPTDTRPPTPSGTRTTPRPTATGTAPRPAPDAAVTGPSLITTGAAPRTRTETPSRVPARSVRRPVPQPRPTDLFADLLLGVLSGRRPVHSMLRHTQGRAYDELAWLAERGPLRTRGTSPVVRDIGYCEPRPGAIEAFARIGAGEQLRAMAFRLELGQDLRWRCTAVELGGPRPPRPDAD
jgi:hypothetical protein